ncbi:MAG TPA: hypothetical protein V6D05_04270 [Stenomitos sp.]
MKRFLSLTVGGLLLSACMAPVRTATPVPAVPAMAPIAEGIGRVSVSIHWPARNRQVQLIPFDASMARIEVFDASGSLQASASVSQASGQVQSSVEFDLPVGSSHYVQVDLDAPTVTRIAAGRSQDFAVRRNQVVSVPVVLEPIIKTFFGPISAYSISGGTTASRGFARIYGVSVGPDGTVYFPDFSDNGVRAVGPDGVERVVVGQVTDTATESQGTAATVASDTSEEGGLASQATARIPHGVLAAKNGDLFVADTLLTSPGVRIRLIPATTGARFGSQREAGHIYTLRKGLGSFAAVGMLQDQDGALLYTEQAKNEIWRLAPDGSASLFVGNATGSIGDGTLQADASLTGPWGLAMDALGNLVISEWRGFRIRMLCRASGTYFGLPMEAGRLYTIMDSVAVRDQYAMSVTPTPRQMAFDRRGDLYFVENLSNSVYRVAHTDGSVTRVAGGTQTITNSLQVGDDGVATSASFQLPMGLAIDGQNRLYVGDTNNGRIRWLFQ